ncbi:hypothetical protein ACOME3_009561 [Neoechinorhynchus agilis]
MISESIKTLIFLLVSYILTGVDLSNKFGDISESDCNDHKMLFTDLYKNTISSLVDTICMHKAGECVQVCHLGAAQAYRLLLAPPTELSLKEILDKKREILDSEMSPSVIKIIDSMITDNVDSAEQLLLNANTCLHFYGQLPNCQKVLNNLVNNYKKCSKKSSKKADSECTEFLRRANAAFPQMIGRVSEY